MCHFVGLVICLWSAAAYEPKRLARKGQEVMVCGQLYDIGTDVLLWTDPGGYDAYRTEQRFDPIEDSHFEDARSKYPDLLWANRFGIRQSPNPYRTYPDDWGFRKLTPEQLEQVRGGGWDLDLLGETVDQFVLHYDVAGFSKSCFQILQDRRDLSVQFMLDVDGTLYQSLDVKERAWHATTSNTRSIGIEIANVGARTASAGCDFSSAYRNVTLPDGKVVPRLIVPPDAGVRTPDFQGSPANRSLVYGTIQGADLCQYDFTDEQYETLARLTALLVSLFPNLPLRFPSSTSKLPDNELAQYQGVLGHHHVQANKIDPGPAFQWTKLEGRVQEILASPN